MIVDLFAGAGGWTCGLESLGLTDIGFEIDRHACATRAAAGYATIQADIASYPLDHFGEVDGLIASPPCQDFSVAGARRGINGDRGQLVTEVLRWAEALRPRWIACEQVPPVLPIWRDYLFQLSTLGYSGWAGIFNAADYGVPQTRKRAFLLAHRDRPVSPPRATHAKNPQPSFFHDTPKPWVTAQQSVGWLEPIDRRQNGAPVVDPTTKPAPTLTGQAGGAGVWVVEGRSLTIDEAATLQGFPVGYPWQGPKTAQHLQIGNAVPPPVAAAVVGSLA